VLRGPSPRPTCADRHARCQEPAELQTLSLSHYSRGIVARNSCATKARGIL
jgi:hypothetical protein